MSNTKPEHGRPIGGVREKATCRWAATQQLDLMRGATLGGESAKGSVTEDVPGLDR
jgi:hypothetical protein